MSPMDNAEPGGEHSGASSGEGENAPAAQAGEPAPGSARLLRLVVLGCAVVFFGLVFLAYGKLDPKVFHAWAGGLNGWLVFAILVSFPLFGFPVSVLFVLAGARFGSVWGAILATVAIAVHLLVSHWVTTTFLHEPIARFFRKTKYRLPQVQSRDCIAVTLLTSLVPGVPYGAKNYLLPLAGVPLRPYVLVCLPSYAMQATVAIFLGDLSGDVTLARTVLLIVYAVVVTWLARYVVKRLRPRRPT